MGNPWILFFQIISLPAIRGYVNYITHYFYSYQHSDGQMRLRVTTLSRRWVTGPADVQVNQSFYFLHYN